MMDEWMNEWKNEWMNEWMNDETNEWWNKWMNEWMNEWKKERKKRIIDWIKAKSSCSHFWKEKASKSWLELNERASEDLSNKTGPTRIFWLFRLWGKVFIKGVFFFFFAFVVDVECFLFFFLFFLLFFVSFREGFRIFLGVYRVFKVKCNKKNLYHGHTNHLDHLKWFLF